VGLCGQKFHRLHQQLLDETGIVATPGVGFGKYGEGYIRFSITQPTERIKEAAMRLEEMK